MARRLAYELYQLRHPGEPWLSPQAIRFLESRLNRTMIGFEWGSGRSTAWLGRRLRGLTSIEHDAGWHAKVSAQLLREGLTNVDCRLIAAERAPRPLPRYVAAIAGLPDQSLDFVLVDGHYRLECIPQALPKLKAGGYLVIDNTNWPCDWGVPYNWPVVHQSENVVSETTVWRKPHAVTGQGQ